MIIKSLRVQNYRCIRDETLPCEQLTVLVGRNGSGKSAFLHALDTFYNANARYTVEDFYAQDTSLDIIRTANFCCSDCSSTLRPPANRLMPN